MALLADYAITPDVFDVMSYQNEEGMRGRLELIREPMLTEGVVRDLRRWRVEQVRSRIQHATWHRRGKELIRKLATQGVWFSFRQDFQLPPADDDQDWCAEALDSHGARAFGWNRSDRGGQERFLANPWSLV